MHDPCRLCGETEHRVVSRKDRQGKALDTVLCMGCGIVTNAPIPSDEELAEFYRKTYRKDYKGSSLPRKRQVYRNFSRLAAHFAVNKDIYAGRNSCLDIGSGSGEFIYLANSKGMQVKGIEVNEDYSDYCREQLGLDVSTQTLEEAKFPQGKFDLIRLNHVLEHMPRPVRSLETINRWLSRGGVLYIEVPNIESEAHSKVKGRLFHYGHIFNFNPFTFRLAAGLAGLEEIPASRQRLMQSTSGFFERATESFEMPDGARENAARMKAALDAHYAHVLPQPEEGSAGGRFAAHLRARLWEIFAARRFATHRDIADHFAHRT